jgi:hypothetical protein
MKPYVQYVAKAVFDNGEEVAFTLEQNYEINCAFSLEGDTFISVLDNDSNVHHFLIDAEWFSQSFVICGDLDTVWEEV